MPRNDPSGALVSGRRALFGSILAAIALAASIAAAETLLRLYYRDVSRITGATEWETATWQGLTYHWDQYHPRYGWTNRPGYRSDGRVPFRVTINDQGLRAPDRTAPRAPAPVKRIAFFGDSLAFGEEVHDSQTVPAFLERQLQDSEVLNFGVHGYGLGQMALRLEDEAFAYAPDRLVVMLMLPEDLRRDLERHFVHNKPVFAAQGGKLVIGNVPVPEASQQPWLYRRSFLAAWLFSRASVWDARSDPRDALAVADLLLHRIALRAAENQTPLTLITVGNARDLARMQDDPKLRARFDATRAGIAAAGLDVLDLSEFLEGRWLAEGQRLRTRLWHWSARGNCLIAEQIAGHLAATGAFARHAGETRCPDP